MKSAREIKEQYASIRQDTCDGYQDEHIITAMEEYAAQYNTNFCSHVYRAGDEVSECFQLAEIFLRPYCRVEDTYGFDSVHLTKSVNIIIQILENE